MQCLSPVSVPNRSRFFDNSTLHPLLLQVRCGKCANCLSNSSAEWYFRAYKHFEDCISRGGYVLFDTLTYREQHVPRLSYFEEFSCLNRNEDMYCFMSEDLRQFHTNLRSRLKRLGFPNGVYDYFICGEYGADDRYTHRPHYHCLFYVYAPIDPLVFSAEIQNSWFYGHTDGLGSYPGNKSPQYVLSNVFRSMSVGGRKVCNYVCKYVQKSSVYTKRLNKRIKTVLNRCSLGDPLYFKTEAGRLLKRRLFNLARQHHRQSCGFGSSAIRDVDFTELYKRGHFVLRGADGQFVRFPISQYFHRKICYDKVWLDGSYCWSLKVSALPLVELRKQHVRKYLTDFYRVHLSQIVPLFHSVDDLVTYVTDYKGRQKGVFDESPFLGDRMANSNRFVYRFSSSDVVVDKYLGNSSGPYRVVDGVTIQSFKDYCVENAIDDSFACWMRGFDKVLADLSSYLSSLDHSQDVFDSKQLIRNKYKQLKLSV